MAYVVLPYQLTDGTVADAAQVMSNFNAAVGVINGGIDNTNLSSAIAITDSRLNQIQTAGKVSGTALIGLASIPSGAGVIPAANLSYINVQYPYIKVSETQVSGTNGGSSIGTTWTNRVLNTTDNDTANISSLGSNQITLPAGTYLVKATAPFYESGNTQMRLQNITGATTLLTGQSSYVGTTTTAELTVPLSGLITLSTISALALQYYLSNAVSSTGLGNAVSAGTEVYAVCEFTKIQ